MSIKSIKALAHALRQLGAYKEAQQVEELQYAEPWHEEAVKEFGAEPISEEEYQADWEQKFRAKPEDLYDLKNKNYPSVKEGNAERLQNIAEKEGFKILSTGNELTNQTAFLGSGMFGDVFRGVYQGHPAAIKIVLDSAGAEKKNWDAVLKIKEKMPPELQKYLPQIYKVKTGIDPNTGYDYDVVIMEELLPLSGRIKALIANYVGEKPKTDEDLKAIDNSFKNFISNPENIAELIIKIRNFLRKDNQYYLPEKELPNIFKAILNIDLNHSIDSIIREISLFVVNAIIKNAPPHMAAMYANGNIPKELFNLVLIFIKESIDPTRKLPRHFDKSRESLYWESIPETKGLFDMLKFLDQNGIKPSDIHSGNIMMDKDGNLKMVDVGNFIL